MRVLVAAGAALSALLAGAAQAQEAPAPELDEVIVQATRSGRLLQDEPVKVEVIGEEEIAEKIMMRPGNIAMLVAETGGIRVQVTAPGPGSANVRVQGMRGRYTQLLADGLPLYGGQAASLGLLQIPPTDLGQVEIIKGAASALYGPSALGGVINLVSRRPGQAAQAEALLNLTTRNGQDLTAYGATPLSERWSASLVGGAHSQARTDLDGDGWADMAGYRRVTARPRLFFEGDDGSKAYFTIGAMTERREGGTLPGRTAPDGRPFPETQDTRRLDAGMTAERPLAETLSLHLRASAMNMRFKHGYGEVVERDHHRTLFAEVSVSGGSDETPWLVGVAAQSDDFHSQTFPDFDFTYTTPAIFGQVEHEVGGSVTLAASARWDAHSEYGGHVSPRFSALWRPGPWTLRASVGRGFYAPTPFVEEIEAAGLSRLEPLSSLEAETADTAAFDAGWRGGAWEANLTLFASDIRDAVRLETVRDDPTGANSRVRLFNVDGSTRTGGAEVLLRYRWDAITVTGSYVYVDATEPGETGAGRRRTPLTPRHTGGVVAMWEAEGMGRLGFEAYYTGRQPLDDDPYRSEGRSYFELGLLGEVDLGRARVFLNLENLLNVRQSKFERTFLPRRAPDGGWTVAGWAPTDGFVANAGVRVLFGG